MSKKEIVPEDSTFNSQMRKAESGDDVMVDQLLQTAPIEAAEMMNEVRSVIAAMENDDVRRIVEYMVDEVSDKLMIYPAAKRNHHAIRSGLLYHIVRMLRTAKGLCQVYDGINSDILYAGVILHDIEKINEMNSNEYGFVSEYTKEGQLLGHIIMGITKIDEVAKKIGISSEVSLVLQHMILSHHYEPEFGSPKKPMIPEAELLHYLDLIDARVYDMQKSLSNVAEGKFSEPIFSMDRRIMYKTQI